MRAQLALNHGEPAKAIETLRKAELYELGVPLSWFNGAFGAMYPVYLRGQSYLAASHGVEAAGEFQKILDHRGVVGADPIGALVHLQLGRARVLSGDVTSARAAYRDFTDLWSNADRDIPPILRAANAEYARLP